MSVPILGGFILSLILLLMYKIGLREFTPLQITFAFFTLNSRGLATRQREGWVSCELISKMTIINLLSHLPKVTPVIYKQN